MGADDLGGCYARQPKARQHKAMEDIVGVAVASHNVAVRTDRSGPGKGSAGIIVGVELAPAEQIGMSDTVDYIPSDYFTAGIDIGHVRVRSAGRGVDGGELAIAQHKPVDYLVGAHERSHNLAAVDPEDAGRGGRGARDLVKGGELANGAELIRAHYKVMGDIGGAS